MESNLNSLKKDVYFFEFNNMIIECKAKKNLQQYGLHENTFEILKRQLYRVSQAVAKFSVGICYFFGTCINSFLAFLLTYFHIEVLHSIFNYNPF